MSPRDRERLLRAAIRDLDSIVANHVHDALAGDECALGIITSARDLRDTLAAMRAVNPRN